MDPEKQKNILEKIPIENSFTEVINNKLFAEGIDILQINLGNRCNLTCKHCHVDASPNNHEIMAKEHLQKCLDILEQYPIKTVDLTGGSPEMHPDLEWFLDKLKHLDRRVLVRTNLVILLEEKYKRFIEVYADNGVELVGSFPGYNREVVDRLRGDGVFEKSLEVLQKLNQKGYGIPDSGLVIDLVSNPAGSYLPGSQAALEAELKENLGSKYNIQFNNLFSLTNCPVGRFLEYLVKSDNYEDYMQELVSAYNENAVQNVMCRNTLSVGWDGMLYDCDFNQMLKMPIDHGAPSHLENFDFDSLQKRQIVIGNHCFSCTAGAGSSCQGAIDE